MNLNQEQKNRIRRLLQNELKDLNEGHEEAEEFNYDTKHLKEEIKECKELIKIFDSNVSEKEFYFLYGYKLAKEYQIQGKEQFKEEFVQFSNSIGNLWSEVDPYMLTNYLPEHNVPKEFYDDFVDGVSVAQDEALLHAYLEVKGFK